MQEKTKWKTNKGNFRVGSMVLISDENLPSYKRRLGRILEVHTDSDDIVNVTSFDHESKIF